MSRPLRIEYPHAWYHVMNRGRRYEDIYLFVDDYEEFIRVVKEAEEQFGLRISAYCLMANHYHLLVQTPYGNISRCMRHINGVYTQRFNKAHNYDGQLFRGRYKAVLVENDGYLLQVMRYIHRNPIDAGVVDELKDFQWSSHHAYHSKARKWNWLNTGALLDILTPRKSLQLKAYRQFISEDNSPEIDIFYSLKNLASILGSKSFKEDISARFGEKIFDKETRCAKELAVPQDTILDSVCLYYNIDRNTLLTSRRGVSNKPRDMAMFLVKKYRLDSLTEIGSCFGIEHYSTVSNAISRARMLINQDILMAKDIDNIEKIINKG